MVLASKYTVSLKKLMSACALDELYLPRPAEEIEITSKDVSRPGLLLAGRDDYFDRERVQFLGIAEIEYMRTLGDEGFYESANRLFSSRPPVVICTRALVPPPALFELARKYEVPFVLSHDSTSACMSYVIGFLGTELAERITRHGVMVEVYGEGVLIIGESGVGKSETAVELIKRGHRLIADDAVEIRKVSNKTLVGSAPENIRHFIELRGVGVINAREIFGVGAVKLTQRINMVIQLEHWNPDKVYDRMGLDNQFVSIMDVKVPITVVPVQPGRNLAIIIETAAMNNRQKQLGFNAASQLLEQLGMEQEKPEETEFNMWADY
jgi:HPr kinase/phosphorylase